MPDGDRISLCIIAKDEEKNLARCLASAAGGVDEIVVLDTGSQDATVSVAEAFGARVVRSQWADDFAEARNLSIEQAAGDWILWLDADDELSPEARQAIRPLVRAAPPNVMGYQFVVASWLGEKPGGSQLYIAQTRLWRNRPQHRFHGAIHEWLQIESLVGTPLKVYHYGYLSDPVVQRRKSERNVVLVRKQLETNPQDARYLGYLAVEYASAGRLLHSLRYFRQSWRLGKIHYVGERYARVLIALHRYRAARSVLEEAIERFPDYTDVYYHYGCVLRELGEYGAARAATRRCLELGTPPGGYVSLDGCGSYLAQLELSRIEADCHRWGAAIEAALKALAGRDNLTLALPLLVRALVGAAGPSGALQALTESQDLGPATRRLLARAFAERRCWTEALDLLRQAGTEGELPGDRLLRAECLLALDELDGAAEELRALEGKEIVLNSARRSATLILRCLIAWMRGDREAAAATLTTPLARRAPSVTRALEMFHAKLSGENPVPPEATSAQTVLLRLARYTLGARRWDLTEHVVALLGRCGPPVAGAVGRMLARHGRPADAKPFLRRALAGRVPLRGLPLVGGRRCDLLMDLGGAALDTGEYAEAARAFERALDVEPNRFSAHLGLAETLLHQADAVAPSGRGIAGDHLTRLMRRERLLD